jgi:hypothetical protein
MKTYGGVEVLLHAFLTSALDADELTASCPGHFTHKERAPTIHWKGSWVGSRASLDTMATKKSLLHITLLNYQSKNSPSLV